MGLLALRTPSDRRSQPQLEPRNRLFMVTWVTNGGPLGPLPPSVPQTKQRRKQAFLEAPLFGGRTPFLACQMPTWRLKDALGAFGGEACPMICYLFVPSEAG